MSNYFYFSGMGYTFINTVFIQTVLVKNSFIVYNIRIQADEKLKKCKNKAMRLPRPRLRRDFPCVSASGGGSRSV